MADATRSNLEPIEEADLNLKEKFLGAETSKKSYSETAPKMENIVERKEGVVEKEDAYAKILSKVTASAPSSDNTQISDDSTSLTKEMDEESKIKILVNLAEMKGIAHAVKVAKHYEDNFLLDEFHDRLIADELHDALVKRGLIKEV